MADLLKPVRGGFLRPFGCGWFIREFLLGHGPHGSARINPNVGAPQVDIFYHYKNSLRREAALDKATRAEERRARHEKRRIDPDNIEKLAEAYLARMPYKTQGCRFHSFVVYFSTLVTAGLGRTDWQTAAFAFPGPLPAGPASTVLSTDKSRARG